MHNAHNYPPIQIIRGEAADRLLNDPQFVDEWSALCAICPWAIAFQGPAFIRSWVQTYREKITPIVAMSRDSSGQLVGMIVLARYADGKLFVAGAYQAEYQAWICIPELAGSFPPAFMAAVRRELPSGGLVMRYLPPGIPLDWVKASRVPTLLQTNRRPLLRLGDGAEIARSLRRGSNRGKINRLKRLGELRFRRVTDPAECDAYLERISELYDLRHGAVYGNIEFANDPLKLPFHRLMLRQPGLMHMTVLTLGDELIAAHLGIVSGPELQLGIMVHHPCYAKQSPGKLHIYMLSQLLLQEGLTHLDLTPGGEPYKERFANDWDEVHTLAVFASQMYCRRTAAVWAIMDEAKRRLQRWNLRPVQAEIAARSLLRRLRHPIAMVRDMLGWVRSHRQIHVLACRPAREITAPSNVRRDCIADLLCYQPRASDPSREAFLATAMARLEAGQHSYTVREGNRLIACAWLGSTTDDAEPSVPDFDIPEATAVAHDFQFAPGADSAPLARELVTAMLGTSKEPCLHVLLPPGLTSALLASGDFRMQHVATITEATRFGKDSRMVQTCIEVKAIAAPAGATDRAGDRSPGTQSDTASIRAQEDKPPAYA